MLLGVHTGTDALDNGVTCALKLNIFTLYDPEILMLGMHAKAMSTHLYKRHIYAILVNYKLSLEITIKMSK